MRWQHAETAKTRCSWSLASYYREEVVTCSPYRGYAVYLARKHTPYSNREIGEYFGEITYSAVTKVGTRLKEQMRMDEKLRGDIRRVGERLSRVKG
jgi:chromosomal replication initiation ATPase DnaA